MENYRTVLGYNDITPRMHIYEKLDFYRTLIKVIADVIKQGTKKAEHRSVHCFLLLEFVP